MRYLKDIEIWLSNVPVNNPLARYLAFVQNEFIETILQRNNIL
jgi:hypothetical protein